MQFSEKMKILLKSKNLTGPKAGKLFGVSHPTVAAWQNGAIPRMDVLNKIAAYFEINLKVLTDNTLNLPDKYLPENTDKKIETIQTSDKYKQMLADLCEKMPLDDLIERVEEIVNDGEENGTLNFDGIKFILIKIRERIKKELKDS